MKGYFCDHDRLDEDGICRQCGADKRGIGAIFATPHISISKAEYDSLVKDQQRLDWLEARRVALNKHSGTDYGWTFVASHNVTRLFVRDVNTIDLNDAKARGGDIRTAVDTAMRPDLH